jgi:hypothetical protein
MLEILNNFIISLQTSTAFKECIGKHCCIEKILI